MKLLLKLKDMCYYEYNGEVVWIKNKQPYLERSKKLNEYLTDQISPEKK